MYASIQKQVLNANNAFREFYADLDSVLVKGVNTIEIEFLSNPLEANKLQASQPYYIPYLEFNCDIADGNMLRKTQCDFGWGLEYCPCAIWFVR